MSTNNNESVVLVENQCTRCAGLHKVMDCNQPPLAYPWNILGHPTVGVYIGPGKIEIGKAD